MAEDVLGITGVVNIDDIQKTFDTLISDLERLGVETEQISARMSKALTDIANSSEKDMAAKTKAAMQVLNDAIADTNKQLRSTPEMLKNAEQEASRLQGSVAKLESELGKTVVGSKEFDALNKQLESQREVLRLQITDVADMRAAHEQAAATVSKLQGMYDAFVSSLQGANEAQHEQQQAQQETTQHTEAATQAVQRKTAADKEQAQAQNAVKDAIADTQKTIDELVAKQKAAQKKMEKLRANMEKWAARGIEGGYVTKTGEGKYKANKDAAGYNENVVAQMQRIAKEYNALKQSLQEYRDEEALAREGLAALTQAQQENAQQTQQTTQANEQAKQSSPRQELMQLRNEITMLTLQYREMTDAEKASAEGQALKAKLDELAQKASKLQDAFSDVQEQIKNDASDTGTFQGLTQGLNLVISGFGAAQGAAAAFGMSEEDLARAQTMIQGSLAATNALTEASNALQSQSAVMRSINTLQTWAAAKATDMETAAKGRNIIATKAATVAQVLFNAVAKANPYVLLAMAIVTVVGALVAFTLGSKKAAEAEKKQAEEAEKLAEKQKHMAETIGSATGNVEAKYRSLQHQWARLKTEAEKTKWIKDNASNFNSLGLAVKGVNDAEKVLVEMAPQVIAALKAVAKATAFEDLYKEAIQKKAKEWENRVKGTDTGDYYKKVTQGEKIQPSMSTPQEWIDAGLTYGKDYTTSTIQNSLLQSYALTQAGIDRINKYRNDQAVALRKRLEGEYDTEIQHYSDAWDAALREAEEARSRLPKAIFSDGGGGGTDPKQQPQYKSARELSDELLALTKERIDNELALEKEGTDRYMQLMRERIALQEEIDTRAATQAGSAAIGNLDASYRGGKSGMTAEQYAQRRVDLEQQTQASIAAIAARARKDIVDLDVARLQATQERLQMEKTALLDYLQTYGDYEQQKLAITQSYEERIANAKTMGERMTLERQMEQALSQLDMEKFKDEINWETIFNDLDKVSLEHLQKLKERLKEMLNSDNISAENAQVIAEQIGRINEQISTKQKEWQSAFGLVIPELERIRRLKKEEAEAQERLNKAQERQAQALREVEEARRKIVELAKQEGIAVDGNSVTTQGQGNIFQMFQNAGKDTKQLSDLFSQLGQKESALTKSTQNLAGAEEAAGQAAQNAGSSFASTVAIIDAIVHGINDNVQSAKELFDQMGLADTKFGKGFSKFAESSQYATDAWESLKSGNVMGVANGVYGSLRTLGEALGEWGISGFGSSDTSLHEDIERLTQSNKDLELAINNLADKMDDSSVASATDLYEQQKQKLAESEQNTREMMQRSAGAYSNGFLGIGGSHSSGYQINNGVSGAEWDRISKLIGRSVRGAGDFFNLTSEEMYKIATEATDIYSHIKDLADDGYENAAQFMDQYLEYWKQLEALENAYLEKLTSTSFDNIESDFTNALLDMDSDAQTFADNFEKYMQQAIINSLVSERYKPLLEKWYKAFGSFMRDGSISEYERQMLLNGGSYYDQTTGKAESFEGWNSMTESALAERDALRRMFDWGGGENYEQEASSKSWQTMSQDTAEELNGRFTALYECGLQLLNLSQQRNELLGFVTADVSALRQQAVQIQGNITELLDVQLESLSHLQNIDVHTASLPDMADFIEKIYNAVKNVNKK